jgi:hypothetical protein
MYVCISLIYFVSDSNKIKMEQRNGFVMKKIIIPIIIVVNITSIVTGQKEEDEGQDQISEEAEEVKESLMSSRDFIVSID